MRTTVTIDGAGRIVVPRKLRDELHLVAGTMLQLERLGDRLTLTPTMREARLEIDKGTPLIFPADTAGSAVLSTEMVDEIVARGRLQRGRDTSRSGRDENTA
jgi:AbrB family looped-hinge helix DNA binding protein